MPEKIMYGGKNRLVHIGANGGKYVVIGGKKRYVNMNTNKKTVKKNKSRMNKSKTNTSFLKGG